MFCFYRFSQSNQMIPSKNFSLTRFVSRNIYMAKLCMPQAFNIFILLKCMSRLINLKANNSFLVLSSGRTHRLPELSLSSRLIILMIRLFSRTRESRLTSRIEANEHASTRVLISLRGASCRWVLFLKFCVGWYW